MLLALGSPATTGWAARPAPSQGPRCSQRHGGASHPDSRLLSRLYQTVAILSTSLDAGDVQEVLEAGALSEGMLYRWMGSVLEDVSPGTVNEKLLTHVQAALAVVASPT